MQILSFFFFPNFFFGCELDVWVRFGIISNIVCYRDSTDITPLGWNNSIAWYFHFLFFALWTTLFSACIEKISKQLLISFTFRPHSYHIRLYLWICRWKAVPFIITKLRILCALRTFSFSIRYELSYLVYDMGCIISEPIANFFSS